MNTITRFSRILLFAFTAGSALITSPTLKAQTRLSDVDLQVIAVTTKNLTTDGQTLAISGTASATVRNFGVEAVASGCEIVFFEDGDLNGLFDSQKDNVLGSVVSLQGIAPLQKVEVEASLSGFLLFSGNRLFAVVDPTDKITEINENNNYGQSAAACGLPLLPATIHPVLQMAWTGDGVASAFSQVIATPMVVHLNDDNNDGILGRGDIPQIIFAATDNVGSGAGISPGILRAINGKTGAIFFEVTDPALRIQTGGQIAIGDIDDDSLPEILAPAADAKHLLCFEHDGRFKWQSPEIRFDLGGASIADLDHNGQPEIVAGAMILNANGQLRAKGTLGTGRNGGTGPLSIIADLDLDGNPEIIAGNTAYRANGTVLWQNQRVGDGFTAVANLDSDAFPEIILISVGFISALEHDGTLKWGPIFIPGGGEGGAPTVADVDGDGQAEIGIAGALRYNVFETDGTLKWSQPINDVSSGLASSTIFDFENDGRVEIVYGDQNCLFFFDGNTGKILFQIRNPSGTLLENPVVADVDGNGQAELVAVRNQVNQHDPTAPQNQGIFVFADSLHAWAETRQVWNQYGYHVTNVTTDGRIPTVEAASWLTHNTFRTNLATESRRLIAQPDLIPSRLVQDSRQNTLSVRVGNGGNATVAAGVMIALFAKDAVDMTKLIGVGKTVTSLPSGAFEDVTIPFINDSADSVRIIVIVDDDGSGKGKVEECNESNNRYEIKLPPVPRLFIQFESPADSTRSCETTVSVVAKLDLRGSVNVDSCTIMGALVKPDNNNRLQRLVPLAPGWNDIVAVCVANGGTLEARDTLRAFFNQPPIANAGGPYQQFVDVPVQFDATGSIDPENTSLTFAWNFGDGSQGSGPRPTHIYTAEGVFTAALTVTDEGGCTAIDTVIATIQRKTIQPITVRILSPANNAEFLCQDSVEVLASIAAVGIDSLPPITRCEINGRLAAINGNTFAAKLAITERRFSILARCVTADGETAVDSIVVFNNRESEPPAFAFNFRGFVIVKATAVDSGSGIADIKAARLWNGKLVVEPFKLGAKRVDFSVEVVNPNEPFGFDVNITDLCGNITPGDPIFMEVAADNGRLEYTIPFPPEDRYLTIENNGISGMRFDLNDQVFTTGNISAAQGPNFPLSAYGTLTVDLGKLIESEKNLLRVTIPNELGHSARLMLMNVATTVDYILDLHLVPKEFALWQNYPNPFNPETRIVFDLPAPQNGQTHHVRLEIFNSLGQRVKNLVDGELGEGRHVMTWEGRDGDGLAAPSGVYLYRLQVGERQFVKGMVLLQ